MENKESVEVSVQETNLVIRSSPVTFEGQVLVKLWGQSERLVTQSYLTLRPWTVARQAPLSMGFPRQEYWSG